MGILKDILFGNFYPRKSGIDDCWDSATELSGTGVAKELTTSFVEYTNDRAGSYGFSTLAPWDGTTNSIDCSMLPVGSKLDIILVSDVENTNQDNAVEVEIRCPNDGNPFVVREIYEEVSKSASYPQPFKWQGYVGVEIQQYGLKIYSRKTGASTVTVANRKILVRA